MSTDNYIYGRFNNNLIIRIPDIQYDIHYRIGMYDYPKRMWIDLSEKLSQKIYNAIHSERVPFERMSKVNVFAEII